MAVVRVMVAIRNRNGLALKFMAGKLRALATFSFVSAEQSSTLV